MGNVTCCPPPTIRQDALIVADGHTSNRRSAAARATAAGWHPVVTAADDASTCIQLIHAGSVCQLPVPWPRSQDLSEEHFLAPEVDTLVLAISHGWMYQAHPDPTGAKGAVVKELLARVSRSHCPSGHSGHTVCFLDFCSVPQRAFRDGQAQRTQEEKRRFDSALRCMPNVYLLADAVLHVDMGVLLQGSPEHVGESLVQVDAEDLRGACLQQLGEQVQVLRSTSPRVQLFDIVVTCDGMAGLTASQVMQKVSAAEGRSCPVELQRLPFGVRNEVPVGERGWIYLERFVTMVKAAMVEEHEFERVCFSNSPAVLEQIRAGSARLRQAALEGEERIKRELGLFFQELDHMHFSGASTDKILGTAGEPNQDDRVVVRRIMREMMLELPALWLEEKKRQCQRRLTMAVSSGDLDAVKALLRAGADVNAPGKAGETCLHRATLQDLIEVARVLLQHGADVHLQDAQGNCAAHNIFLMMSDHIVEFMELLAPDEATLSLRNVRQVSPLDRFRMWAPKANDGRPFAPAVAYLDRVCAEHPSLRRAPSGAPHVAKASSSGRSMVHSVRAVNVCGHKLEVDEWAPTECRADADVVVFSFGFTMPPTMMTSFWDDMLRELQCSRFGFEAKYYLLNRVGALWRGTTLVELQERLMKLVEQLPLHNKFILVDDARTFSAGMILKLRPRLLGVLLINTHWCVSDEFLRSASTTKALANFHNFGSQTFGPESFAAYIVSNSSLDGEAAEACKERMTKALRKENKDYFEMMNWMVLRMGHEWASSVGELLREGLDVPFAVPAVLVTSAFAPEGIVVQSTIRLSRIFPQATISYIPNSRLLFHVEGEEQFDAVLHAFEDLLRRVDISI